MTVVELAATHLTLGQSLALLFAGEQDGQGFEITTPSYSANLVVKLCEEIQPVDAMVLRRFVYGKREADEIDFVALVALDAGYRRWHRTLGR